MTRGVDRVDSQNLSPQGGAVQDKWAQIEGEGGKVYRGSVLLQRMVGTSNVLPGEADIIVASGIVSDRLMEEQALEGHRSRAGTGEG